MRLQSSLSRGLRAAVLALPAAALLAPPADATWSIILVDRSTGEIAIGNATCLTGLDLEAICPVMLTGIGAACAQSSIDGSGSNRRYIWDEFLKGTKPRDILNGLAARDPSHQSRQYGIIDLSKARVTFTGRNCGEWAGGLHNALGTDIAYVIQGNVLAGSNVVAAAELAIQNTPGDLAEKLMAAMEAAHQLGGDGRCSCDPGDADRCGSPPPMFDPNVDKSAHIGFMMISRIGDIDGDCNASVGCADGSYWMNLNVPNAKAGDVDPTIQLRGMFDDWREGLRGRPDHIRTARSFNPSSVLGNGTDPAVLTVTAIDWEGKPVGHGGAAVTVRHSAASAGLAAIGDVVDHGDGTYTIPFVAGAGVGTDEFEVVLDDGGGPVLLFPFPTLKHRETLTADVTSLSATTGGTVNFTLKGPDLPAPPPYLLLGTLSGTVPGTPLCEVVLPLNLDWFTLVSYELRNTGYFVNTDGTLEDTGNDTAQFVVDPGDLVPLVGLDLAFAWMTHGPVEFASNAVTVTILQ